MLNMYVIIMQVTKVMMGNLKYVRSKKVLKLLHLWLVLFLMNFLSKGYSIGSASASQRKGKNASQLHNT